MKLLSIFLSLGFTVSMFGTPAPNPPADLNNQVVLKDVVITPTPNLPEKAEIASHYLLQDGTVLQSFTVDNLNYTIRTMSNTSETLIALYNAQSHVIILCSIDGELLYGFGNKDGVDPFPVVDLATTFTLDNEEYTAKLIKPVVDGQSVVIVAIYNKQQRIVFALCSPTYCAIPSLK